MTVTVIHGQQHKGSTYQMSRRILQQLGGDSLTIHEFFMPSDGPAYCVGCYRCFFEGEQLCPHAAKVQPIVTAMEQADIIIVDSPAYCLEMTGQLKTLFDHLAFMWMAHRPNASMFGKVGIVVSTASGAGGGSVTRSLARQLFWLGTSNVYRCFKSIYATNWETIPEKRRAAILRQCDRVAAKALAKVGKARPSLRVKAVFSAMRQAHRGNKWNAADTHYWQAKGWLGKSRPW